MRAQAVFWLITLWAMFAIAAEPDGNSGSGADQHVSALQSLAKKVAEAKELQNEIERLRQLLGEPPPNVRVRVRLVDVSLTKIKSLGLDWPNRLNCSAGEIDEQLTLLTNKGLAKLQADEIFTVAHGSEARLRAGTEWSPSLPTKEDTGQNNSSFRGSEIAVTPRLQADGRLVIELVCKQRRPIIYSTQPHLRVHQLSTAVELATGEATVLDGLKEQRIETVVTGFAFLPARLGRVTDTINEVQTLVVVSREQ